jgi:DNA-binding GntR family transcriptional regulator
LSRTLETTAYHSILDMILDGRLARGSMVSEVALAKQIGTSRTPVRHAIRQLESQGLVEQVPKVGTVVRVYDRHEVDEVFGCREAIESYAASRVAEIGSAVHLAELQRLCDRVLELGKGFRRRGVKRMTGKDQVAWIEADYGFHRVLLDAAGNRKLLASYADLHLLTRTLTYRIDESFPLIHLVARTYVEHSRILRAIVKKEPELARVEMVRHIRATRQRVYTQMLRQELGVAGAPPWDPTIHGVMQKLEHVPHPRPSRD